MNDIFKCDAVHLSGGNTFYFLHILRKRGLIELANKFKDDRKTYTEEKSKFIINVIQLAKQEVF